MRRGPFLHLKVSRERGSMGFIWLRWNWEWDRGWTARQGCLKGRRY